MNDSAWLPLDVLVLMVIVMPIGVAVFFGLFAFRRMTPLAFQCRRCGGTFQRPAHYDFPVSCSLCRARDWNA